MTWRSTAWLGGLLNLLLIAGALAGDELPGTEPLTLQGDIASQLVDGVDKFLLRKLDESTAQRQRHWHRDFNSPEAYSKSLENNRQRLAHILGVRGERVSFNAPELIASTAQPALVAKGANYEVYLVRWPVLKDPDANRSDVIIHGEGLLLTPTNRQPFADIVALPDAEQTPEQIAGLTEGVAADGQFARILAEWGCRVLVPTVISRELKLRNGRSTLTNREYLYRPSFELGRHLVGYEVQKVLAGVDWFDYERTVSEAAAPAAAENKATAGPISESSNTNLSDGGNTDVPPPPTDSDPRPAQPPVRRPIGVVGYGEGGMLALYAAALDTRIDGVAVGGYFDNRNTIWQGPIDRNVFGLLDQFGDAELISMVVPRKCYISSASGVDITLPGQGGAPATATWNNHDRIRQEVQRLRELVKPLEKSPNWGALERVDKIVYHDGQRSKQPTCFYRTALCYFTSMLSHGPIDRREQPAAEVLCKSLDTAGRQQRQLSEIDCYNQLLLTESPFVRAEFMKKLYDVAATKDLAAYEKVADEFREVFYKEVIGKFEEPLLPANPRSRKTYDHEKWTGYEVTLDVFPDVMAYGVLLLPKDIKPGEKRPVVVCQHGLEGRPKDVIEGDNPAYHDYAAKLAEQGFITFAPQNLYIFTDRFRSLQRKANPLGKTLFSIIVPQHQQITNWLSTLPNVDADRIAFYGLSYGGKSAMRIPPLVKNYCLSICSADFNEWVWKNASTRSPHSYVWTGEYEIFEFDLGSTFNYAEMAALIAPRPFMVERGHFDAVSCDEAVAYEFAKVRNLYAARLGLGDRCEIEFFVGPHTINGQGTFKFLHDKLNWPPR